MLASCLVVAPVAPLICPDFCPLPMPTEPADPPTPVVRLKVRVPSAAAPGQPVEYRIRVDNVSAGDAHNVVVKNALPANAKFVRASPEPHAKEPELEWRLGTMKAGTGCDITLILQPTNLEDLRNCTRVSFEHGQCVTTRLAAVPPADGTKEPGVFDPKGKDKEKEKDKEKPPTGKEPPIMPGADEVPKLTLAIDGPKTQYLNLATRYFLTVTNKSKVAATNLLVECALDKKAVFLQASDDGKFLEGKVAWLLGTLEPGGSRTVVVALKSEVSGELCHRATALADKGAKAQAEICTMFGGVSALLVEMFDVEDPIEVGEGTFYPVTIRNTGSAPVTNVRLKAFIPDNLLLMRAKGPGRAPEPANLPNGKVLEFDPHEKLEPGAKVDYEVYVRGAKPGDVRFRIEMRADQLEAGPVIEEESTRVFVDDGGVRAVPLSRRKSPTTPYSP